MSLLIDLVKNAQGKPTDKVDAQTKKMRINLCDGCEHLKWGLNCGECGCFVSDKTNYAGESCPIGKWKATIEI